MKTDRKTGSSAGLVAYAILMIATVVTVDILFFRHHFGERLLANILIVLAFLAFYLIALRRK